MNGSIVLLLAVYSIQSAPISAKTQKLDHEIAAGNIKAGISSGTNRVSVNGSHDQNQKLLKKRQYDYDYNQDYDQQTGYNNDYSNGQNEYDTGYNNDYFNEQNEYDTGYNNDYFNGQNEYDTGYNNDYSNGQNEYDTSYSDQSGDYKGGNRVDDSEYWNNLKRQQEEEGWYGHPAHKNDDKYNNGVCEPGNCGPDIPLDYFEKYIRPKMNK